MDRLTESVGSSTDATRFDDDAVRRYSPRDDHLSTVDDIEDCEMLTEAPFPSGS